MRVGGDRMSTKQTAIRLPIIMTAETNHSSIITPSLLATPTESASQGRNPLLPETTEAGKRRQRMKWTLEANTFIMRTYYKITKLESKATGYRETLHKLFMKEYPGIQITGQRIFDHRRAMSSYNMQQSSSNPIVRPDQN
ncbi:hypothetical protein J437_LFUL018902 [Ladona fulva]|uniref:Uncharacterized protein n=1 Tax=Ladona fulva TaxID=123851 RepID=A0A8K0KSE1_LADFU|nr:hypothetical protein J437_LFUL018902 [Ladona fulva]